MSEEEAQQLVQQLQALEAYAAEMGQREGALARAYREAAAASESIRALGGESDALVPVGLGAFVSARIEPGSKILLDVGAGVSIERDAAYAASYVEARIKEIDVAVRDAAARRRDAAARLEDGRAHLERMMQAAGRGNV